MKQRWPDRLWIVRHGESAGNVAREAADAARLHRIDIASRDVDVPLSPCGEEQSTALGRWFAAMPAGERPDVVLASPYVRARRTAELIAAAGGLAPNSEQIVDERLREKEFGVLDRLTRFGIEGTHPEQAEFRRLLGKFYHRPPGGESWCDVILRLRSALDTMSLHHGGRRVLVVGHQVVVLCLRYLLEEMDEARILKIDAEADVANCSVTEYAFDPDHHKEGGLVLRRYNFVAPLERAGAPVTAEPDVAVAAR
jgi:broad specificity phosphatase PhoE